MTAKTVEPTHKRKSAEQIFAANDTQQDDVYVPEWDTYVLLKGLTGAGRDDYEADILVTRGSNQTINARNARAKLIVRCAFQEDGVTPLFTRAQIADLGKKSGTAIQKLFEACRKISGLTASDMDELTEAFEPAQNGASTSD